MRHNKTISSVRELTISEGQTVGEDYPLTPSANPCLCRAYIGNRVYTCTREEHLNKIHVAHIGNGVAVATWKTS